MRWTRKAKPRIQNCLWCFAEFEAIRSDAWTCSPKCRMALSRDPEIGARLRGDRNLKRLKKLGDQHRISADQQWKLDRKALEKRIAQALLDKDSGQLAIALYELETASPYTRRLKFYPYRSFDRYCQGRWQLDPEKVRELTNSFLNPVIAQYLRSQRVNRRFGQP